MNDVNSPASGVGVLSLAALVKLISFEYSLDLKPIPLSSEKKIYIIILKKKNHRKQKIIL